MDRTKVLTFGITLVIWSLVCIAAPCDASVAPGDLDTTFGTNGKVTTDFSGIGGHDEANAIAIDGQGRIIAAGFSTGSSGQEFALARYNADGRLDTTFGTNGKVTTDFNDERTCNYQVDNERANAIAMDSSGRIIVAGTTCYNNIKDFALARYNADGSLDTTFGSNGKVTTDLSGGIDHAYTLAIDSYGRIIAAGLENLARYNTDGRLDTTFGTNGKVTSWDVDILALAIDSQGRITVAGRSWIDGHYEFALARYSTDGGLDTTFGTNGIVTTDFGGGWNRSAKALEIDSSGKIIVAGYAGSTWDFAVARYSDDGSLDTTFGTNGTVTTDIVDSEDEATALAIDSSGKIVVAGTANDGYSDYFALVRYNIDGSLDTTFGTNGKVTTGWGDNSGDAFALAIDSSERIVVAGTAYVASNGGDFALARYLAGESNPPRGSITINGGAETTKNTAVTLTLTAIDDTPGKIWMCIANKEICTTWTAFAETKSWTLTAGNGTKTVYVSLKDVWGNVAVTPYSDTIVVDTADPIDGTVTATPGDAQVTLDWMGFTDTTSGIKSYKVVFVAGTAPPSCSAGTVIYSGTDTLYIHDGLTNGTKYGYRVCARDKAGNVSTGATASAKPMPETNPPTGSITIKGGAEATKSIAVTLTLAAIDDTPGKIRICIANKETCTTWTAFAETKSWTLTAGNGTKTVYVSFKDVWGNVSVAPYSDTILLDTIAPTNGTVTATPGDAQVALDWTGFTDTGSGIESYRVVFAKGSAPASCSLGKQIYDGPDTTYTHTGLTNGTVYYYRVCAIDKAGNKSTGKIAKAKAQ